MTEHLEAARTRYLNFLRAGLRRKAEEQCGCAPELLLLPDGGRPGEPELHRLHRMDLVYKDADDKHRMTEFNLDPLPGAGEPVATGTVGSLSITLFPVVWNALEVRYPGSDLSGFDGWYARWLNQADDNPRDADGLAGVVHHAARHTDEQGWQVMAIDGGSAPVTAVTELLQLLEAAGVAECAVGSFSYVRGAAA
jgi:hypothetical protein